MAQKSDEVRMQDMLRMIGFGENLGSGFPKIIDAWKDAGWKTPVLEDRLTTEEVRLTLPIPFAKIAQENKQIVADNVADELTERQSTILNIIIADVADNVAVNTKYIAEKLNLNRKTIQRELSILQEKKLVIWVGSAKNGYWAIFKDSCRD